MPCYVCGSDSSDYICESCKREVCFSHARSVAKSVMCIECLKIAKPAKAGGSLDKAFSYMLTLTIGLVAMFLVNEYVLSGSIESYASILPGETMSLVVSLKGISTLLVGGSVSITVLLFLAKALGRKTKSR